MNHDHIPDDEIRQDIADTEQEIDVMEREATALELLLDRWSHIRAAARRNGIIERQEFIAKLQAILADRYDPTPWCTACGAMTKEKCDCGPIADNN